MPTRVAFDFDKGALGWQSLFSDYPVGQDSLYRLTYEHTPLPTPLQEKGKAVVIGGINHSDDLLSVMYLEVSGLKPNFTYRFGFTIEFASNACTACLGVGGDPNLSIGVGGLDKKPENKLDSSASPIMYRPNFLTEIQGGRSNAVMQVIGSIGVSNQPNAPYALKTVSNEQNPIELTANSDGKLWLLVGVDSGFEATTMIYYRRLELSVQ